MTKLILNNHLTNPRHDIHVEVTYLVLSNNVRFKIILNKLNCNYWAFGLSDFRTMGPSVYRTFGLLGFRNIGPSDYWADTLCYMSPLY